MSQKEKYRKLQ